MAGSHYRRNYISRVIVRVDVEPLQELLGPQQPSPIAEQLGHGYTLSTVSPVGTALLNPASTDPSVQQQPTGIQWEHRKERDGTKLISVSPQHIALEYGANDFDHFAPFRVEFMVAFEALTNRFPNLRPTRVGVRYVNEIRIPQGDPLTWDGYIARGLREATLAGLADGASLSRSMHQLQSTLPGDLTVLMHYGIFNPKFPAPVSRREFILDIDCFTSASVATQDVPPLIDRLNETCQDTFEASIDDQLRALMAPI